MNINIPRWMAASINDYFNTQLASLPNGAKLFFEGQTNRTVQNFPAYVEMRHDGPQIRELSKDYCSLYVEVNALITVRQTSFVYQYEELIGKVVGAFMSGPIHLYKYGPTQPDPDDQSLIGCLYLLQDGWRHKLEVNRFGQIQTDVRLQQASVEGHYEGRFYLL
jgi:hypothetical protein